MRDDKGTRPPVRLARMPADVWPGLVTYSNAALHYR
jgi:hypothetical protein